MKICCYFQYVIENVFIKKINNPDVSEAALFEIVIQKQIYFIHRICVPEFREIMWKEVASNHNLIAKGMSAC